MLRKLSLFGVVLLLLGVSTGMGHEADPTGELVNYALFGNEFVNITGSAQGSDSGFVGSNGYFKQTSWDKVKINDQVRVTGDFTIGAAGNNSTDTLTAVKIFNDSVLVKGTVIGSGKVGPGVLKTGTDAVFVDPICNDNNLKAEDITVGADIIEYSNGYTIDTTLEPGPYNKIKFPSTSTKIRLKAGVYVVDTLDFGGDLIIDKKKDEFTRIIVRGALIMPNTDVEQGIETSVADDYGRVLVYVTGTGKNAVQLGQGKIITATLFAPNADVSLPPQTTIYGQLLAKSITIADGFDGSKGKFVSFINSNIHIDPPEFLYENVDDKPQYDTAITCSLSSPIPAGTGNYASLDYKIILGSGEGFANNTTDLNISPLSGTVTFTPGVDKIKIPLTVLNDTEWEPDETFTVIFDNPQTNVPNYTINLGTTNEFTHVITIKDDDPKNSVPTDISLSYDSILEIEKGASFTATEQMIGTLSTEDTDAGDSHTYSIIAGTNKEYFGTDGNKLVTTDLGAKNIDFETAPNFYTLTIQTDDGIATFSKNITVHVKPKNDNTAKGVARELYNATENIDLQIDAAAGVLKNATDADDPQGENRLEAIQKTPAKYGTVTLGTDGSFKYVQDAGLEVVIDSFSYTITDKTTYDNIVHTNVDTEYWAIINITAVDDNTPIAGTPDESTIYENEEVIIDVTSLISDGDGTPVTIAAGPKTPTQGAITIDPSGKITYKHDGTKESPFSDSFEYVAVSGGETSAPATVAIVINPINDNVSVATPNSYSVEENGSVTKNVITDNTGDGVDSDADEVISENIILAQLVDAPANHEGTFTLNPDGSFTYKNDGTPGSDQFTYKLTDDVTYSTNYPDKYKIVNTSNTVTVTINVSALNSSTPTARDTIASVDENKSFEIDVAKLIDDADLLKTGLNPAEKLTVTVPAATAEGEALMKTDDGTIIQYTHGQGDLTKEVFTDVITYTVTDGAGHTATGDITVTINPKNDNAPAAQDDAINAYIGVAMKVYPLKDNGNGADDFDLDEERIHTTLKLDPTDDGIVSGPDHGTLVREDDYTYTYTVDPSHDLATEGTTDEFVYRIIDPITSGYVDATVHNATAKVTITIAAMPGDVPIPHDDEIVVDEGGTATVLVGGATSVMDNDEDSKNGSPKTHVTVVSSTTDHGTVDLKSDGTFTYTHDGSENFSDFFEYVLYTANDQSIINGRVNITINPKNDNAPIITPDTIRINEGESATIGIITDKDSDVDEGTNLLAVTTPKQGADYGTVTILEDGTVTYTHNGDESGSDDEFIVTITDSVSYDPTVKNEVDNPVVVIITAVNDNKPSGTDKEYRVDENGTLNITDSLNGILSDATDLDGGTLTVTTLSAPEYAVPSTFVVNSNGTFFYEQNSAEKLVDQFTVTLSDGELDTTLTITININPLNDEFAFGTDETFELKEGKSLNSTITLSGITDADRNDTIADPFGNTYRIELVSGKDVQRGTLTLNPDGSFIYVNNGIGEYTTDSFTYVIIDSTTYHDSVHTSEEVTVTFTISDENDETPVTGADTILVAEGETTTVLKNGEDNVTWNDSDADANTTLEVSVVTGMEPKNGTITLDPSGTFTYVHDGSATVVDSFHYEATDGLNVSTPTLVFVHITAKPPVAGDATTYHDKNADGIVDSVVITYNHDIDKDGSDFKLRWAEDNEDITITDTAYGASNNIVVLTLDGSKQYRTSGRMILTTVHSDAFLNVEVEHDVADKAAPVVSGVHYDAKQNTGTLAITLSEHMAGSYDKPFTLIYNGSSSKVLNFTNDFTNSGTTYSVEVPFSEQEFEKNDSIYITVTEKVADGSGNEQLNPDNIRQPILSSNGIVSAAYFDTSSPADGKVDKISVTTALQISDDFVSTLHKDLFAVNVDRKFEITGFELTDEGFDILVTDNSEKVETFVTESDFIKLKSDVVQGASTLSADSIAIQDSIAPIILKGTYGITSGGATLDTTIILTFSEPVKEPTGSPYGFYDRSNSTKFDMTLEFTKSVTDVQKQFKVSNISIDYVVSGDSVRIEDIGFGTVTDSADNVQHKTTVYAPIEVTMDYGIDIELLIYPQPLVMDVDADDRKTPRALHEDMVSMYNLHENFESFNGVAFVVEANGPLSIEGNSGKAQLFDQTGNAVSDELTIFFEPKTSGNMAGVAIWDGKNPAGRVVGRNSYLLVVEVSVLTDEGSSSRVIEKQFIKTVGVTF